MFRNAMAIGNSPLTTQVKPRFFGAFKFALIVAGSFLIGFLAIGWKLRHSAPVSPFEVGLRQAYPDISKAMQVVAAERIKEPPLTPPDLLQLTLNDGFRRVDDAALYRMVQLRYQLTWESDIDTCATLWNGNGGDLVRAIGRIPADQQRKWAALLQQAADAINESFPLRIPPTPEEFRAAMVRVVSQMPAGSDDVLALMSNPEMQTPEQKCRAAREIYSALITARFDDAVAIERGLVSQ
jgi:hypothetical protein